MQNYGGKTADVTADTMSIAAIGNQVLFPLLAGLEVTVQGRPGGLLSSMPMLGTSIPMGTDRSKIHTFALSQKMRREKDRYQDPDFPSAPRRVLSPYAQALFLLHDQVMDAGYRMGLMLDNNEFRNLLPGSEQYKNLLPPHCGEQIGDVSAIPFEDISAALSPEKMAQVPLKLRIDGKEEVIYFDNVVIGSKQKSLAHVILGIGLAGRAVKNQKRKVADFLTEAIAPLHGLPPAQSEVYNHLRKELHKKGYEDPDKILVDSGCDVNRKVIRKAFEILLPYGNVYELACQLRWQEKPDYLLRAFHQIRKYLGASPGDATPRDGYECAQILEAMADYAIALSTGEQSGKMAQVKMDFIQRARKGLIDDMDMQRRGDEWINPPPPTVADVMAWPQSQAVVKAFPEAYAAAILLDRNTEAADKAWAQRVAPALRENGPSGHSPL